MSGRRPTLRDLINDVVRGGSCSECAACVVACPYGILQYVGRKPEALPRRWQRGDGYEVLPLRSDGDGLDYCSISEKVGCDVCASVCPKLGLDKDELEYAMFGRTATEAERSGVGVVAEMHAVRSRDPDVLSRCQDGGFVTTLLLWALETGRIDGAVVTRLASDPPCKPVPAIARTREEILSSAGSWYTYSPNTLALTQAAELGLSRVAFVGTPCQVTPLRKLMQQELLQADRLDREERNLLHQRGHLENYAGRIAFMVGLFCSETFTYEGFMQQKVAAELGIPLEEVSRINIKGKVLIYRRSGEVHELPLKEAVPYSRPECSFCGDFSAEEADISAGGVGTDGWTLVLLRTPLGQELFRGLLADRRIEVQPISNFTRQLDVMHRLARKQRERERKARMGMLAVHAAVR